MKRLLLLAAAACLFPATAWALVRTETIEYRQGDHVLEGYLAYDNATAERRPTWTALPSARIEPVSTVTPRR